MMWYHTSSEMYQRGRQIIGLNMFESHESSLTQPVSVLIGPQVSIQLQWVEGCK